MNIYKLGWKKNQFKKISKKSPPLSRPIFRPIQASGPAMDMLIPPPKGLRATELSDRRMWVTAFNGGSPALQRKNTHLN